MIVELIKSEYKYNRIDDIQSEYLGENLSSSEILKLVLEKIDTSAELIASNEMILEWITDPYNDCYAMPVAKLDDYLWTLTNPF